MPKATRRGFRPVYAFFGPLLLLLALATPGQAQEKLRVGKAIQNSFTFALLDVGISSGVFKQNGFEVEPVTFTGAAKLQQALTSGDIEIGLSTGQDLAFILKGLPAMTVAAITNAPFESVMLVRPDSPIKTAADLKGKNIAVSNIRGYPSWQAIEFSKHEGWGPDGVHLIASGSQPASMALLKTGQVDGWVGDVGTSFEMEQAHEGRIIFNFSQYLPPFMNTAMYARNSIIAERPETVRRFIKAWLDNIAWARTHRKETVAYLQPALGLKIETIDKVYGELMMGESTDGRFQPKAMETMKRAVVDLGILDSEPPDITKLYTEEFLPKS
jgi:sulfonate transport system substrate-binding protein